MAEINQITHGQVHLWYVRTAEAIGHQWLTRDAKLLSVEEVERHQRFVFQKDRNQFLIGRVLLRQTLSRYSTIDPQDWRFQTNEFGKPEIDSGQLALPLRFNLSHCDGLVLCGVTVSGDLGVDCENVGRQVEISKLAPRVFSVEEQMLLASVPAVRRAATFFRLWTLKEAYIKARGLGMALPLQGFSFELGGEDSIRISFGSEINDRSESWQFATPTISGPFVAAVGVHLQPPEKLSLTLHSAKLL